MADTKYDTKYNGGEKMSSWDKLLKRFLELDHDIRFEEIVKVMKELGTRSNNLKVDRVITRL